MEHQSFFPRSTRNRIALGLAILSLLLFFAWNFMPAYKLVSHDTYERDGFTFQDLWPDILNGTTLAFRTALLGPNILAALLCFLFILHCLVMMSIIPAWKLWQSTFILRLIPAILIIACGLIFCYLLRSGRPLHYYTTHSLVAANIFTTALSLLCFKNEFTEPERPH